MYYVSARTGTASNGNGNGSFVAFEFADYYLVTLGLEPCGLGFECGVLGKE
jgi:hypothetical protein